MLSTRIEFSQNLIQAAANMNAMLVKPAARIRFSDSKDVVDNNEVRQLKTNISTTASPNLNIEEQRLKTFERNWPLTFISARTLAKTGFYYIGPQDQVRCYFCKVEVSQWDAGDNEVTEHSRWSPHCPLLKRRDTPNVPLEPVSELEDLLPPLSYDVCGPCGIDIRPGSYIETQFASSISTPETEEPVVISPTVNHEIHSFKHSDYPEYAIEAARLQSYNEWPKAMKQRPKQLSDAGLFYTQKSDRVICFSCGGSLRDWDDQDEPWEQHALWYGKCDYVRLVKGQEYVDAVKAKYAKLESESNNGGSASSSQESVSTLVNSPCDQDEPSQENNLCESRLCKICYSNEYNTVFMPCGHVIACTKCASSVTKCPLCRKPFERVMRVFFS